MRKLLVVLLASIGLIGAACGASGESDESDDDESSPTTIEVAADDADWGTLRAPCGPGDYTVDPAEAGRGTDKLYLGTATDKTSSIRPGLNKDMWDASVAFAAWCNDQGGVGGLQIEVVDLEGAMFEVERAMTVACEQVFAMVGGGLVQDNLEFSGQDSSDFHRCGMIDIPGFAVSPEKSDSNGQIQPIPNPGTTVGNTWIRDYQELYPEDATKVAIAYGDLPSLEIQRNKYQAAIADIDDMDVVDAFPFPAIGLTDWTPLARTIIDSGATTLMFVGEASYMANLLSKLREQGWKGRALLETNMYEDMLFSTGADVPEGSVVRLANHPFEEAADWPATQKYLDTLDKYVPDARKGSLGINSISAWLLFATAANACAEKNDGVLDRTCILEQAAAESDWTGGGLHSTGDPASYDEFVPAECGMLLEVTGGKFVRLFPEVDGPDDDGDGFHCRDDATTQVPANEGKGVVDPNRPI